MGRSSRRSASTWPEAPKACDSSSRRHRFSETAAMLTSSRSSIARAVIPLVMLIGAFAGSVSTKGPRFYPDDPISREPESQDASKAQPYEIQDLYEMTNNLFVTSGYKPSG